ncbi:hypothetical protein D3C73_1111650 [compost metagenome]
MAWERAEEAVFLGSVEFRYVEGHRVGFLGTNDLGVGDDACVTLFDVVLVDAGAQAVGSDRLHVGFLAQHPVMAHYVLRQAAGVGQFHGEGLAAFIDLDGLGAEGHLVSGVDGGLALSSHQLAAGQRQQGYRNKFGKHGESPRHG